MKHWGESVSPEERVKGLGCQKGVRDCLCLVGFPPAEQCADCREEGLRSSRCVCDPKLLPGGAEMVLLGHPRMVDGEMVQDAAIKVPAAAPFIEFKLEVPKP